MSVWNELSDRVLEGGTISRHEALTVLAAPGEELLEVLAAAYAVRHRYFGRGVTLHVIRNAQSGICTEDCAYCSQSAVATSEIPRYPLQTVGDIVEGAREAARLGAIRYCMVISARGPTEAELATVCEAVGRIKREQPIQLCTSLGLLTPEQAARLKAAGVDRYNHNLETAERFYGKICGTHAYADRVATARRAKEAGLELCSGGLIGMGETAEDRVDLAFALRELGADSIPVNFLDPRPGTRLEGLVRIRPVEALKVLAMFRLVNPDREIRIAGGREAVLGAMQVLALYPANSMFTRGYLTTGGQGIEADRAMIDAAGFEVTALID
jgi:biotin synthase